MNVPGVSFFKVNFFRVNVSGVNSFSVNFLRVNRGLSYENC